MTAAGEAAQEAGHAAETPLSVQSPYAQPAEAASSASSSAAVVEGSLREDAAQVPAAGAEQGHQAAGSSLDVVMDERGLHTAPASVGETPPAPALTPKRRSTAAMDAESEPGAAAARSSPSAGRKRSRITSEGVTGDAPAAAVPPLQPTPAAVEWSSVVGGPEACNAFLGSSSGAGASAAPQAPLLAGHAPMHSSAFEMPAGLARDTAAAVEPAADSSKTAKSDASAQCAGAALPSAGAPWARLGSTSSHSAAALRMENAQGVQQSPSPERAALRGFPSGLPANAAAGGEEPAAEPHVAAGGAAPAALQAAAALPLARPSPGGAEQHVLVASQPHDSEVQPPAMARSANSSATGPQQQASPGSSRLAAPSARGEGPGQSEGVTAALQDALPPAALADTQLVARAARASEEEPGLAAGVAAAGADSPALVDAGGEAGFGMANKAPAAQQSKQPAAAHAHPDAGAWEAAQPGGAATDSAYRPEAPAPMVADSSSAAAFGMPDQAPAAQRGAQPLAPHAPPDATAWEATQPGCAATTGADRAEAPALMEAGSGSEASFHSALGSVAREGSLASSFGAADWHDALPTASPAASIPATPSSARAADPSACFRAARPGARHTALLLADRLVAVSDW